MKYSFFNKIEYEHVCSYIDSDPYRAKYLLEAYIEKYPRDYLAKTKYIYVLIVLNQIDEAKEYLKQLKIEIQYNMNYLNRHNSSDIITQRLLLSQLRLMARDNNHSGVFQFLEEHPTLVESSRLSFFCKNRLGMASNPSVGQSYIIKQIMDYREDTFMDHIKRHTADYNMNVDEPNSSVFSPYFPLDSAISEVKKYIPSSDKLCYGFFEDTYVFQYDDCGRCNNRIVDYFKVICFNEEGSHLITMYPADHCEMFPSIDLNYMTDRPKIKVMSQIEKFERKYHM